MANEEFHDHGSPGSAGSNNSYLRALAQDTQRVFRIPHRTVLDMLLAHLGLSLAQYERVVHVDGKIRVTVIFDTSALDLGGPISDISVPGAYRTGDEIAEDTAAIKVVRYIEDMTNTVVRDFHASSKRHQRRAERLRQELKGVKDQ